MKTGTIVTIVIVVLLVLAAIFMFARHSNPPTMDQTQQENQVSGVSTTDINSLGQDIPSSDNSSDLSDNSLDVLG